MKLNTSQLQAIKHQSGPLLIVAGAGTGKTTVITERIKYLIKDQTIDPQHIFAVTFTQKAAEELVNRLDQVMPMGYRTPWLGTFHSLCERLLKLEGLEIGLAPNFQILTATDQWLLLKQHLFDLPLNYYRPLGNPNRFISALIKVFSRLQDEDIAPDDFAKLAHQKQKKALTNEDKIEAERLQELSQTFQSYQQIKLDQALYDFGDLISLTLKLFRERPNLLSKYRQQFSHVLVDEFQDTNIAQYELIKLLAPSLKNPNLTVVGDDNQAVYKWRGASVSNILHFKQDYPKSTLIVLNQNYRSTQPILDAAYTLIKNNDPDTLEAKLGISKKLYSNSSLKTNEAAVISAPALDDEVDWTVKKIIDLVINHHVTYQDIAILTRANNHLEPYIQALKSAGLPYQVVSNRGLFDQSEIRSLIYFIRVLIDPHDSIALFQLILEHPFNLNSALVLAANKKASRTSTTLWDQLLDSQDEVVQQSLTTLQAFQDQTRTQATSTILYQYIQQSQYLKPLLETESIQNSLKIKNLNLFFQRLKQFELTNEETSVTNFMAAYESWVEAGENPGQAQIEDIDTINLMTVHAAKGLEFSAVFTGSLIAGRFPSQNRKDPIQLPNELVKETLPKGDEHIQEERRLMYVAMTRAKSFLYLTHATDMGGIRKRRPSGFLPETNLKPLDIPAQSDLVAGSTKNPVVQYAAEGKYDITRLSYSQIDTFKACPLKYKYRYLLQIPSPPHHSVSFGRTIHATLQAFHQREMQGQTPNEADLLTLFADNFISEGYDSIKHRDERFKAGEIALKQYFQDYQKLFARPLMLEQTFTLMLDGIKFVGKIDRVDQLPDGSHAIIDYKTGNAKDQKKVDRDEQLTIYALAAKNALGLTVKDLSLYFIDSNQKVTSRRSDKQLESAKLKLNQTIQDIKQSTFPAKPDPVKCGFCEYHDLCPYSAAK
jgi:DNA helicase-2/ATP-dependent DNA helicase PcrA